MRISLIRETSREASRNSSTIYSLMRRSLNPRTIRAQIKALRIRWGRLLCILLKALKISAWTSSRHNWWSVHLSSRLRSSCSTTQACPCSNKPTSSSRWLKSRQASPPKCRSSKWRIFSSRISISISSNSCGLRCSPMDRCKMFRGI